MVSAEPPLPDDAYFPRPETPEAAVPTARYFAWLQAYADWARRPAQPGHPSHRLLRRALMHRLILLAPALAALALSGCVTASTNVQNPTASEQLLTRHAARRAGGSGEPGLQAAGGRSLHRARGPRFGYGCWPATRRRPGRAAVAEVLQHLSTRIAIVDSAAAADVRVDLVVSAAGIDDEDHVLGLPPISIPAVPGRTSSTTTTRRRSPSGAPTSVAAWWSWTRPAHDERNGRVHNRRWAAVGDGAPGAGVDPDGDQLGQGAGIAGDPLR